MKQVFGTFIVTTDSGRTGLTTPNLRKAMIKVIFVVGFFSFILFLI